MFQTRQKLNNYHLLLLRVCLTSQHINDLKSNTEQFLQHNSQLRGSPKKVNLRELLEHDCVTKALNSMKINTVNINFHILKLINASYKKKTQVYAETSDILNFYTTYYGARSMTSQN